MTQRLCSKIKRIHLNGFLAFVLLARLAHSEENINLKKINCWRFKGTLVVWGGVDTGHWTLCTLFHS